MFQQLSDKLEGTFKTLRGQGRLNEKNIADAMREIRMALLEADVDFKVARELIARVKEKALGQEVLKSVKPGQQIVKIFQDELTALLGGEAAELDLTAPARILMVGLNGAGKTTTSGKLAHLLKKQGRKPLLVALDLFRPAAVEQLATLAEEIGVPVFKPEPGEKHLVRVAREARKWIEKQVGDVCIFDTAGRQEIDEELVSELKDLQEFLEAKEVLLVADAATGQQAVQVARTFDEQIGLTGIVLSKLDGDARGGAALSMREVTGKPIKFAGQGEKLDQLEAFLPDRMAGRILGMGDVVGLVEKAAEVIEQEEAERLAKKLKKNKFDFNDFLDQLKFMQKLGPLEGLLGMMPGIGKQLKNLPIDERRIKRIEAMILSMTPLERSKPDLLKGRRRQRIAKGSGNNLVQVNQFLKQFTMMRKMMKSKGKMKNMMDQLGGMEGLGGMGGGGSLPKMPKGFKF
ncbi:MAG: signal recognition particle protein [Verrucomicrobiota bacterium]